MVKGLDIFLAHFRGFADQYVLIGGTACDIAMAGAGLPFRATKDLDIVLIVEALDGEFVRAFWQFFRVGGYTRHSAGGAYRNLSPPLTLPAHGNRPEPPRPST